jgi:hypothetical protein
MYFQAISMVTLTAFAIGAVPQEPGARAPRPGQETLEARPSSATQVGMKDLLDSKVVLRGEEASDDAPTCAISDYVISFPEGRIQSAVVRVGGVAGIGSRYALLSMSSTRYELNEDGDPCFKASMTKEQIEALPEFNLDEAKENSAKLDHAAPIEAGAPARVGTPEGAQQPATHSSAQPQPQRLLASQVLGCKLHGSDEEFGEIDNLAVDSSSLEIGYLLVSHGGTLGIGENTFVIPLRAVKITHADKKTALKVDRPVANLSEGVQWEKPKGEDDGILLPSNAREADALFQTARPQRNSSAGQSERD